MNRESNPAVPLKLIDFDPKQPRKDFKQAELAALGESIKTKGQLQPVLLYRAYERFTLLAGERRVRACLLVGLETIWGVIVDTPPSESELRIFQLIENCHRVDLSCIEKFEAYCELLAVNPGWTQKDLAKHLNISEAMVSQTMILKKCIPAVLDALREGKITGSDCVELGRTPPEYQAGKLNLVLSEKEPAPKRTRVTGEAKTSRIKCELPTGVCITVAGESLTLDELIESLTETTKQAKKAQSDGLDVKTFQRVLADKAKK